MAEGLKENRDVEFKRKWDDEYLKTLCAFANADGGMMFVGVDDDGNPVEVKDLKKLLEDLPNKIKNKLGILASVSLEKIRGKEVIKIEVHPSDVPISYNGKFYLRTGSTVQEINGNELIRFILKKQNLTWDAIPSEAGIDEIDEKTVQKFKKLAKERLPEISDEDSIEKILQNLELLKDGKLTNAGVLLFGKNPQKYIINAGARAGRFRTSTDITDTVDVRGNLFEQVDGLMDAIKKHISVRFEIEGVERRDVWDYPLPALREAVINALIHRDYLEPGDIQIKIYDDRIWFWNPGKLPEGLTVDMLKREHPSIPRNRLLATVFYFAGLIEKWGSGTKRIVELCKEQGLPEPDFKEEMGGFSVVFYKDIYTEEHLRKLGLNERQIKAVMYVKERGRITNKEYRELCKVSERTATRDLSHLVSVGIFRQIGTTGRGTEYKLSRHNDAKDAIKTP
ncbi:ATP-binding protein [Geoglobus acetivorans]|uniref:Helix-turn-helix domain-containing protein n=1 Tax=Geoglobus acetivorans TaxID=565033 RepID=A0ABZ3H303_GEOAI|nr:putative DNA binding domain-containing protein [Geoglobus acetivorans]